MPTPASSSDRQRPGGEVVVVFGGRSEIGLAVARRLAPGRTIVLASRPGGDSSPVAPLWTAGATAVETVDFDADGNAYVTANGVGAPGSGEVVMVHSLVDLPGTPVAEAMEAMMQEPAAP